METTLHRQLKERYAIDGSVVEQRVGRYRIDVVQPGRLVEMAVDLFEERNCRVHPNPLAVFGFANLRVSEP